MTLKVLIRTDASNKIGAGHVSRCLALAESLVKLGADVTFVCRDFPDNLIQKIRDKKLPVEILPVNKGDINTVCNKSEDTIIENTKSFWQADAEETIAIVDALMIDCVIVDQYNFDTRWETLIRKKTKKLVVFEDFPHRKHYCDLIVDPTFGRNIHDYKSYIPSWSHALLGTEYALLDSSYSHARRSLKLKLQIPTKIFVYFGSSDDALNLVLVVLSIVDDPLFKRCEFHIVVSSNLQLKFDMFFPIMSNDRVRFYSDLVTLTDLILSCDFAIGAAGSTTWERCCLGLPSILVVCAENQASIGEQMHLLGAAEVLNEGEFNAEALRAAFGRFSGDPKYYLKMAKVAAGVCDGGGADRVAQIIIEGRQ